VSAPRHGVVLGGGWTGMLAAHVLARHLDTVTVVERDVLPSAPGHRKGEPQARHVHILWSGGARIVEDLLPGTADRLVAAGARRIAFQSDLVTLTSHGWQHRFAPSQFAMMCGRPLLDFVVREQILATGRVGLRQGAEAVGLVGDPGRVAGVRVRDLADGTEETLDADLVVDASGRGSGLRRFLAELGLPRLEEDTVDAGITYATKVFRAPPGATAGFPAVNVAADHRTGRAGRFGVVYPQEDDRWMVTLSCTRGGQPPQADADFLPYARSLRDPLVADLIEHAEPLTEMFVSHIGANRRLYPERLPRWPAGLVVLGDALAAFNPIYGHGMSAAARAVSTLDAHLTAGDTDTAPLQAAISAAADDPWIMATSKDVEFAGTRVRVSDPRLTTGLDDLHRFGDLVAHRAIRSAGVCAVATDVLSMTKPQSELASSGFLSLIWRDRLHPELTGPPLTADELDLVGLAPRGPAPVGSATG
jgi:2-polyprenyl-6-methoxyphenol hydroxylase-like FAD-dependent oxidoreductase